MNDAINHTACETLFTQARTHNGWLDKPVSDAQLQAIWDLMKMGPTSANCSPARIVFVRSAEGKEKLRPTLSSGNLQKTMQAPVTAIVAWDSAFYDRLPILFPPRRRTQLVYLQPAAVGRDRVSQQLAAGGVPDFRLPRAGPRHRADVRF